LLRLKLVADVRVATRLDLEFEEGGIGTCIEAEPI
jgi:hypothetical protein